MADTETPGRAPAWQIERLRPDDAEALCPLSIEAGWNQVAADWRLMLSARPGFGIRGADGRWIGSALALPLGPAHRLDQHGAGDPAGARQGAWHASCCRAASPRSRRAAWRPASTPPSSAGRSICRSAFATSIRSRAGTRRRRRQARSTRRPAHRASARRRRRICRASSPTTGRAAALPAAAILADLLPRAPALARSRRARRRQRSPATCSGATAIAAAYRPGRGRGRGHRRWRC